MTHVVGKVGSWQQCLKQLGHYMPSVLVTGAIYTITQNSPFPPLAMAVAIAMRLYPRRDGQVELSWVAGYILR